MPQWAVNMVIYCLAALLTVGPAKIPIYRHICKMANSINVSLWQTTCADFEHPSPNTQNHCKNTTQTCCTQKSLPHCVATNNTQVSDDNSPCCQTFTNFVAIDSGNFILQFFTPQLTYTAWVLINIPIPEMSWATTNTFFAYLQPNISFGCNKPPPSLSGRDILSLLQTFRC